ncbi:hypothetical protein EIP75_21420 [Aquabacterium soli]|uniref:Uncharacterized protein n=1 Tax=Aquabacterium soli TaxID=2493092 RepID=A0A3R8S4H1_9BURK|nr:stable inheritance protein KleA [Aquabacterium soli]RRS01141.1 hypothetical protein EIP75_21420 [Aquabacterium soli]
MSNNTPFMPWIDHLYEVGDKIRAERTRLRDSADMALELERKAAALRALVEKGKADLLTKVMKNWTLADIQGASEAAARHHPVRRTFDDVEDGALRECLRTLDGRHLASEALQVFQDAGVIREQDLQAVPDEQALAQLAARVLAWWRHLGQPVCDRLAIK